MIKVNTLRTQLMLGILLACMTILTTQTLIRYYWILPAFEAMAEEGDAQDLERVASQVKQELESLHKLVYDSAVWDAMYDATLTKDSEWFEENYLIPESYHRIHINGWYLYDNQGELISGRSYRNNSVAIAPKQLASATALQLDQHAKSASELNTSNNKTLFTSILGEPAVVIFHPVLPSDESGKPSGILVLWRFINNQFVESLTPGISDDIMFHPYAAMQGDLHAFSMVYGQHRAMNTHTFDGRLYLAVNTPQGLPLFALSIAPRPRQFDNALFDASLLAGILITLSVIALFYLWVNKQLIAPISTIHDNVSYAMRNRDFSHYSQFTGRNEAFRLGRKLNEMFALITHQRNEVMHHNKQLEKMSNTDPLTGLANRRHLDTYLRNLPVTAKTGNTALAILMADVDYFKRYNDHYGHAEGDKALVQVANILRRNTRSASDLVVRYGGEEFVIVLQGATLDAAVRVTETLLREIRKASIPHESRDDKKHIVTLSVGVACQPAGANLTPEQLLKRADDALYRAKSEGRDRLSTNPLPS